MTAGPPSFPTARTYAVCLVGVAALTVYGSLVPFDYRPRSLADAVRAFEWVLENRVRIESRSDGAANFVLGIPLGFCLLGAVRVDRGGLVGSLLIAVVVLPLCVALATAVEFTQLWFPGRTCSATDIAAQTLGSAAGMVAWVLLGQRVTNWIRSGWASDRQSGNPGRLLLLYLLLVFAIQVLPFDVMTSPAEVYRRLRDGTYMTMEPFAEWREFAPIPGKQAEKFVAWLRLIGIYLPVGILAAHLPGGWNRWGKCIAVVAGALAVGIAMEAAQIPIRTRHVSTTDVIIGAASIVVGWMGTVVCRGWPRAVVNGGFLAAWSALTVTAGWLPIEFQDTVVGRVAWRNLIPFAAIESKQYLLLLNEMLEAVVMFGVFGSVLIEFTGVRKPWVGAAGAATLAAVIELGQVWLPERTPATTEVVLAAFGGGLGANLWARFHTGRE